jgi:TRAP-type C4-dicarboxylate transport system permease small subunit
VSGAAAPGRPPAAGAPAPDPAWEQRADAGLGAAAAVILLGLVLLTFVDVIGRYVMSRPVPGSFEVTELLLLVLIFAGLPLVSRADEHVTMDFIDRVLGGRRAGVVQRLVQVVNAAIMGLLAWLVWLKADTIAGYGDATDVLRIPYGPFVYFMAVMIGLSALIHAVKAVGARAR